jgi:lysophospholipase L1-like esterase
MNRAPQATDRGAARPVGRKLGALAQFVAALAVTAALLGIIELGCGIYLRAKWTGVRVWAPPDPTSDTVSVTMRSLRGSPVPLLQDLDLLWRNKADAEITQPVNPRSFGRDDTWTIKTSSEAFRGPERQLKGHTSDVYRILCVGDSVTFGFNVDQEAPYARQLERALRERYPSRQFEVINAGVVGWSWVQGLRFVETEGLALHPNLVIAAHGVNDQFWNARITDSEHLWLLQNPVIRRMQLLNAFVAQTNAYRTLLTLMPMPEDQRPLSPGCIAQVRETGSCHRVSLAEIEASVHEMHRLAADAGIDVLVLNLDFLESLSVRGSRSAAAKDHIPFLDLVSRFRDLRLIDENRRALDLRLQLARLPLLGRARVDDETQLARGPRILFRVSMPEAAASVSIKGGQYPSGQYAFDEGMYDDGTHGDEVANDGVYSVTLQVPEGVSVLRYQFSENGQPEFAPVPPYPSSWADRTIRIGDDGVGYIDVFSERFLMAESVHPNARGHEVIAAEVASQLERFDSFRNFVDAARQ